MQIRKMIKASKELRSTRVRPPSTAASSPRLAHNCKRFRRCIAGEPCRRFRRVRKEARASRKQGDDDRKRGAGMTEHLDCKQSAADRANHSVDSVPD